MIDDAKQDGIGTVKKTVELISGKILNEKREYINFQISDHTVEQCAQMYFHIDSAMSKQLRNQYGGIPEACKQLVQRTSSSSHYSVNAFHSDLVSISREGGDGSRMRICDQVCTIWDKCSNDIEVYYATMLILRNRGIGFGDKLICKSLLQSFVPPAYQDACQEVFSNNPHYHDYIDFLSTITNQTRLQDIPSLYPLVEGQFVSCQLCSPLTSVSDGSELLAKQSYLIENKLDGIRVQLHRKDQQLIVFGRSGDRLHTLEALLKQRLESSLDQLPSNFIVDGEFVVMKDGRIKPFHDVSVLLGKNEKAVGKDENVCLCVFDVLSLNGEHLVQQSLLKRKNVLSTHFNVSTSQGLIIVPWKEGSHNLQEEIQSSLEMGCEGLVLKKADTPYRPGSRSKDWLKLKADYVEGLGDSIDAVIIGGKYGKGQRKDCFGSFLCAIKTQADDMYRPICCVGSGFTERDLANLTTNLHPQEIERNQLAKWVDLPKSLKMDVYFTPSTVIELKGSEITESKRYGGLSLRFPRFIRIRNDKGIRDVTVFEQLKIGRKTTKS